MFTCNHNYTRGVGTFVYTWLSLRLSHITPRVNEKDMLARPLGRSSD
jgi:hypothetical protein